MEQRPVCLLRDYSGKDWNVMSMEEPADLVCPKCGANEVKDLRWIGRVCMGIFFTNALLFLLIWLWHRSSSSSLQMAGAGLSALAGVIYLVAGAPRYGVTSLIFDIDASEATSYTGVGSGNLRVGLWDR